ncbi:MAG: hypothetical protein ABI721_01435 [Candidatus Dojkabacteria bacterium]
MEIPSTDYLNLEKSNEAREQYRIKTSRARATALVKYVQHREFERYGMFVPQSVKDRDDEWISSTSKQVKKIALSEAPLLKILQPKVFINYRNEHNLRTLIQLPEEFYVYNPTGNRVGIEIEIEEPPNLSREEVNLYLEDLDKEVQDLGLLIGYDSLREIPLPPSSLENQLAGYAEMFNCKFILPGQELNTHINFENIVQPLKYLKEMLIIHLCFSASGIFHRPVWDIDLDYTGTNKPITDEDLISWDPNLRGQPHGYPLKVRSTNVTEFRLINMKNEGFEKFSSGLISLYNIIQCFISYTKIKEGVEFSKQDSEQSQMFEDFMEQVSYQMKTNIISKVSETNTNFNFDFSMEVIGKFLYLSVLKVSLMSKGNDLEYSDEFLIHLQDMYCSGSEFNEIWSQINFSAIKKPLFMQQLYEEIISVSNRVVKQNENNFAKDNS